MVEKKLKAYFVRDPWNEDYGVGVIATSSKEAKKLAFLSEPLEDAEWINLRVKWNKDANVEGLNIGHLFITDEESIDAMFRGIYGNLEHVKCPKCGTEDVYVYELWNNVFCCSNCENKLTVKDINNPYVLREENIELKTRLKELEEEKQILIQQE